MNLTELWSLILSTAQVAGVRAGQAGACAQRLRQDGAAARRRRHRQSHQDAHQRPVGRRTARKGIALAHGSRSRIDASGRRFRRHIEGKVQRIVNVRCFLNVRCFMKIV